MIYNITCVTCNKSVEINDIEKYIGMTRTSVHNLMKSHLRDQKSKKDSSPLFRHDVQHHDGEQQEYVTNIVAAENKLLKLSSLEAIHIETQPSNLLMNERNERGRRGVVRITANRVS